MWVLNYSDGGDIVVETYNMNEFGQVMKLIRKSLNLTQTDVRDRVGISENTMMKIEKGLVIPKFDTLELLSLAYKIDITAVFLKYRQDISLVNIMASADEAIQSNNPSKLLQCYHSYHEYIKSGMNRDLINASELNLLECFLKNAVRYFDQNLKDIQRREMSLEIRNVLEKNNPELKWHKLESITFNLWEIRLLNLLALLEGQLENYATSLQILESIYSKYNLYHDLIVTEQNVFLTTIFNLSYHYHLTDQHHKALKFADEGIRFTQFSGNIKVLHGLYYRKGIAQFLLHEENFMDALRYAVTLLEIVNNKEIADLYRKITKDNYEIDIP